MNIKANWVGAAICLLAGAFALHQPFTSKSSPDIVEPQSWNSFDVEVLFPPRPVSVADTTQLVYELHLTNFARDTLTLTNVQVIDNASEKVIAEFQGTGLESLVGHPGPDRPANESRAVAPGGRAIVYFNLPMSVPHAPDELLHRIEFNVMTNEGHKDAAVKGGEVEVVKKSLPQLGPPLRGGPWVAVYNPSWERGHRRVFYAVGGRARIQGRFAIDWMKAVNEQQVEAPDGDSQVADTAGFGAEALAVAEAEVVAVRDNMPSPENCAERDSLALEDHAGNYVVLKLSDGRYAFYEHLQPSAPVQPGDRVRRGQVVGTLGCTGSATKPHLHFHVGNARSSFSEGLPYLLTGANVIGVYDSVEDFSTGAAWRERSSGNGTLPDAFFPAPMMVVQFPEE